MQKVCRDRPELHECRIGVAETIMDLITTYAAGPLARAGAI